MSSSDSDLEKAWEFYANSWNNNKRAVWQYIQDLQRVVWYKTSTQARRLYWHTFPKKRKFKAQGNLWAEYLFNVRKYNFCPWFTRHF